MAKNKKKYGKFTARELENPCKTLLANIRFSSVDNPIKTIAVTSTAANEGKTTVSTNLANAIASGGKRVLLVEGDMRRRSLAQVIGIAPASGIYSVLAGSTKLDEAVVATEVPNLYFLDAEPSIPNPADVCATRRFALLVQKLRSLFDYVIFDTPPIGTFIDAAVIGSQCDACVLALRERSTKREAAQAAVQQLKTGNCNLIGTVMTFVEEHEDEYYAYYTADGKRVNKSDLVDNLLSKGDLADDNIEDWARNMGMADMLDKAPARAASAPAFAPAAAEPPSSASTASFAAAAPAAAAPANPFTPGAFKNAPVPRADVTGGFAPLGKHSRRS